MSKNEDNEAKIIEEAREVWERTRQGGKQQWFECQKIMLALAIGRDWAMRYSGADRPLGRGYNVALNRWLKQHGLDGIDAVSRADLFYILDNLGEVTAWRATLPPGEQYALNNPTTVARKFKAFKGTAKKKA